jgi:beta-N-acetylhexosaminidase
MGTITNEIHKEAQSLASTLSLEEKCASVLLVAYGGAKQFVPEFASGYQRIPVGGVILFAYNIPQTATELMDLTDGIQRVGNESGRIPFIAVDHEGGTVLRLKGIATELPDAREIGRSKASPETVLQLYRVVARQLASLGFSMNLAPVVEPLTEETRSFLSRRALPLPIQPGSRS